MDKVVIIMPAYNEAENIGPMIEELFGKEFPNIKNAQMHLLVVDDYSPDGTGDIVKKYQTKYKNLHLLQKPKEGLGWAYIKGMQFAMNKLNANAVIEMDADFQHPPRFIKDMVKAYLGGASYVIGSRYVKGGSIPKEWAFSRKLISFFGNLFIRTVLLKPQIHDLTTGFRLTRVEGVLNKIDLEHLMEPRKFAHKVDLMYQSIKYAKKVVEVPLEFASRTKEKSKFNFNEMTSTFKVAIILGIKDKIRFVKFAIVGVIGLTIQTLIFEILGVFLKVVSPSIATTIGGELAIISNFILNNAWTFKEYRVTGLLKLIGKFVQFNATSLLALIIQFIILRIGEFVAQGNSIIIQFFYLGAIAIVLVVNYTIYNTLIWKTTKKVSNPR